MNDSRSHQSDPLSTVRNVWHILPSLPAYPCLFMVVCHGLLILWVSVHIKQSIISCKCRLPDGFHQCALLRSPWQVQLFRPIIACIRLLFHKMAYKVPGKLFRAEIHGQVHIPFRISALAHMPCQRKLLQMFLYGCFLHTITYICAGFTGRIHRNHRFSVSCHIATGPVSAITGNIPAISYDKNPFSSPYF